MLNTDPNTLRKLYQLEAHPEGGYYKRTYTSPFSCKDKPLASMIYYLLEGSDKSHFHRLQSDEIWLFHQGSPLMIHLLHPQGNYTQITLGEAEPGSPFQAILPAGTWFAAQTTNLNSYSFCSCVVNPEFQFEGFELAQRSMLQQAYPAHARLIANFTKQ